MVFLFGLGVFLSAELVLSGLLEGLTRLARRRRRGLARIWGAVEGKREPYRAAPTDLPGPGRIPWPYIYGLALLGGLGLYLFTRQAVVPLLAAAPFAVRSWLVNVRKRQLDSEVLAFLMDVRIALPLQGSLLRALQEVARRAETRPAEITRRYLNTGFQGSGLELLERLATDTGLSPLKDLVAWTRAAREGTLGSDAPFEHALTRLRAEMNTRVREQLQRIPTRLTLLVLPALLGPSIVLLLYPVVARLLAGMSGVGWNGGF